MTTSSPNTLTRRRLAFITEEIYMLRLVSPGATLVANIFLARLLSTVGEGIVTATLFWPALLSSY